MASGLHSLVSGFLFVLCFDCCRGQGSPQVIWDFDAGPVVENQTTLSFSATLAPGWHLYSQRIQDGGPIPTRFRFQPDDGYILSGTTEEKGNAEKFYDHTYGMEIIWYTGAVRFFQDIRLLQQGIIKGTVEYMTCNQEICIPAEREFSIAVSP